MSRVLAPCAGVVHPMREVPDPVFSAEMVGSGAAIDPGLGADRAAELVVEAPVAGRVVTARPHAVAVVDARGVGVLVHLGVDTVQLGGAGFELLVGVKDTVSAGDPLVRWRPEAATAAGLCTWVIVCAVDSAAGAVTPEPGRRVAPGDVLYDLDGPAGSRND